jgi:DNA-binding XRE family transcriptional regulator
MKNEYELNVAPFKYYHPKCKITLGGDDMKNEKSERKFDFRPMGLAIKKAREKKGMTQEQLADIIGRDTRTVMYHENDGQHPSLDIKLAQTAFVCIRQAINTVPGIAATCSIGDTSFAFFDSGYILLVSRSFDRFIINDPFDFFPDNRFQ